MSASIVKVIPKPGTSYAVDDGGATDISIKYQVVLSEPLGPGELFTTFSDGTTAIPAIGTVHPARAGYYAAKYDIRQPDAAAKATLEVTVKYEAENYATEGSGQEEQECLIEQWGWDDGTAQRELVTAVDGTDVLNSAGDPFDSVPQVDTPAPTFTKVVRFATRQSGWFGYNCKVNQAQMTISGVTFPARTLLCTVAETMDPANMNWPFKYSIRLRYRSNKAKLHMDNVNTECGWDAVVCDSGMREIDATTNKKKLIQVVSEETGTPATVTSPELLNGQGRAQVRGASGNPTPFNFRFEAYEEDTFPDWFTSEPPLANPPQQSNNGGNS